MKIGWDDVFEELTPPQGGLAVLRARLDNERTPYPRPRRQRLRWAAALAIVVLCVASAVLWRGSGAGANARLDLGAAADNPALVRLGLAPAPTEPVTVPSPERGRMAVEQVPVSDPDVIYYRVAALTPLATPGDSD